jgi:hypothetical protein
MAEEHEEQQAGQKGGLAESVIRLPMATAVTDITIPPDRVQWGPAFAGLLITLAVAFLWTALGLGIGIGVSPGSIGAFGFWTTGFACLGLFLGTIVAARTSKSARAWPAIMHGLIIWTMVMMIDVFSGFALFRGAEKMIMAVTAGRATIPAEASMLGWWFFGGYLCMLVAAILGSLVGMTSVSEEAERPA